MDAYRGRLGREATNLGDEVARRGHREMRAHRVDALPLLDEDEAVGVLDIDMTMMRQTPRFAARPRAMLGAERDHAVAIFEGENDVAGNEDHKARAATEATLDITSKYSRR